MNTRVSTPNKPASAKTSARQEQMPKKRTRPLAMDAAEGSIVVKVPVAAVYKRWMEFEKYPKFITAIKRVRKLDANHFVASVAFNGKQHPAMLEIMLRVPKRRLSWRTISNGHTPDHLAAGVVSFASHPDQSTCVTFRLTSSFGGAVSNRVDRYLTNFKRLIEKQCDRTTRKSREAIH
jgi:uncharacterized membrane protein